MAVISGDTFDPLRRYVRVRLQQGVPIVDADVNEREDIQAFELRAFLKWFVGDGVPEGNDGFRVVGTGAANDFEVRSGITGSPDPLSRIGRCLVAGWDVIISDTTRFTEQDLHAGHGPAAIELATGLGVDPIAPLSAPAADETVVVYLDVWERLVTPAEDRSLIHPSLGTESCARLKREWRVRVSSGTTPPAATGGHAHAALATITRREGDAVVRPGDVRDVRARRLLVPPASLVEDVLGLDPSDYRRGRGRPPISLREAVNALLRGELPGTPDAPVDTAGGLDVIRRAFLSDGAGGLVAAWYSDRMGGVEQVLASRLALGRMQAGFSDAVPVTNGGAHVDPHVGLLPDGDLLVVYQSGVGTGSSIAMKRAGGVADLDAAAEVAVTPAGVPAESVPFLTITGDLVSIFFHDAGANRWRHRRWNHTTEAFVGTAADLSTTTTTVRDFHAAVDPQDRVWAAFKAGDDIRALQLDPATGAVANEVTHDSGSEDREPFVLCLGDGDVWTFWRGVTGIHARRFSGTSWGDVEQLTGFLGTGLPTDDRQPAAVEDAEGGIWLFWATGQVGQGEIVGQRRHPVTGRWGSVRTFTAGAGDDSAPFAVNGEDGAIWLFWSSDRDGSLNPYYRRLVTAL